MIDLVITVVMIAISTGLFAFWVREAVALILADKISKTSLRRESSRKAS